MHLSTYIKYKYKCFKSILIELHISNFSLKWVDQLNSFIFLFVLQLLCGGFAGSTAALFTTPFDVVKTRVQLQVMQHMRMPHSQFVYHKCMSNLMLQFYLRSSLIGHLMRKYAGVHFQP